MKSSGPYSSIVLFCRMIIYGVLCLRAKSVSSDMACGLTSFVISMALRNCPCVHFSTEIMSPDWSGLIHSGNSSWVHAHW